MTLLIHRSELVRSAAKEFNIDLHYTAIQSKLKSDKGLWKVMNEYVRNNVYFSLKQAFSSAIHKFFDVTLLEIADSFVSSYG